MMATYLEKADCKKIVRPFLNAGLSASGVSSKTPRAVVWGPLRYQGLDIRHLWTTQGVEHLLALLRHATRTTLTGQLLRTTLEELQLETGLSHSVLSYSYTDYGCLSTRSWIAATWQFLSDSHITVIDPFSKPALVCDNDCFLMEAFYSHGYRGTDLKKLNLCCLHLQALRLSDICSANGKYLTDEATEVQPDLNRLTSYSWPRSQRPRFAIRSLWQMALAKAFVRSTTALELVQSLLPFVASARSSWT